MSKDTIKRLYRYFYKPVEEAIEHSVRKYKFKDNETSENKEIEFDYLNPKQYKKFLELVKEGNKHLEPNEQPVSIDTVGYTKIGKCKKDKDALLEIKDATFDVKKKRSALHGVGGYIFVTETNKAIAIEKIRILPIILILCILLGGGFAVAKYGLPVIPKEHNEVFVPDIDDDIDQQVDKNKDNAPSEGIRVQGFSKWVIPVNTTDHLAIPLSNPSTNPCYFTFEIILNETGETLYKSKMVPPGNAVKYINISRGLEAGEYGVTIFIYTNELETGAEMNSAKLDVELTVA